MHQMYIAPQACHANTLMHYCLFSDRKIETKQQLVTQLFPIFRILGTELSICTMIDPHNMQ